MRTRCSGDAHRGMAVSAPLPSIRRLLVMCRPSAIAWLVVAVVVDSVNRVAWGPSSHISEEVFELLPSLAHFDAASAVILVFMVFHILATRNHSQPNVVLRGARHSVDREASKGSLGTQTSAASTLPHDYMIAPCLCGVAAITGKQPVLVSCALDRNKSAEALTGDVLQNTAAPTRGAAAAASAVSSPKSRAFHNHDGPAVAFAFPIGASVSASVKTEHSERTEFLVRDVYSCGLHSPDFITKWAKVDSPARAKRHMIQLERGY